MKDTLLKLWHKNKSRRLMQGLCLVLFAGVGAYIVTMSHAATPAFTLEPENGTVTGGAAVVADASSSGGKYVQFGATAPQGSLLGSVTGTIYYIDCTGGSDANDGKAAARAWKTLTKASQATLAPGDAMALKMGCAFNDKLVLNSSGNASSPIIVTDYGSGARPKISGNAYDGVVQVWGSYITLDNLELHAQISTYIPAGQTCAGTPNEYVTGFQFEAGSSHNTVQYSYMTGFYAGVIIRDNSHDIKVINNVLDANNSMYPDYGSDDAGAFGIAINGNNNEIAHNTMKNQNACSVQYVTDGSGVEIYGGSNNSIHHNYSVDNNAFSELGKAGASNNTYAFNLVKNSITGGAFIVTRGAGDAFGPVTGTKVFNNTVYMYGANTEAIGCDGGCDASILAVYNNIIWSEYRAIWCDGTMDEGNNMYWSSHGQPLLQFTSGQTINSSSKVADPAFVNTGTDFHLKSTSPAINMGGSLAAALAYGTDYDGVSLAAPLEAGAYQY